MEQEELIIKNNNLDITLINRNTNKIEYKNVNNLLKKENVYDLIGFMKFKYTYFYITDELQQSPKTACDLILNNGLSFNRRIPLHQINNIYNLNEHSSNKDILKAVINYNDNKKEYVYYCNDKIDKYVAILYHYLTNEYFLRECAYCNNLYLKHNNQGKYCEDCRQIIAEQQKEQKNKKQKKVAQEIYTKEINATRGLLNNNQDKLDNYSKLKKDFDNEVAIKRQEFKNGKISKDEFNNWAVNKHKEIKKIIKAVLKK